MTEFDLHYDRLRELEHDLKPGFDDNLAVRAHRCISWVGRAEIEFAREDYDAAFIFLWIAFNSIYSRGEVLQFREFRKGSVCGLLQDDRGTGS